MAQKENRRKIRAILAGGLVLGVGAAITLAAWNSSEFATGKFGTGEFELQGSLDGTTFANHPAAAPAELTFSLNTMNLSPGDIVSAPFAVQLTSATTYDATVMLNTGFGTDLAGLSYRVFSTDGFGCASTITGSVVASRPLVAGSGIGTFDLTKSVTVDQPGATANLCFEITAGAQADLSAGASSTAVWEFAATQKN